MDLKRSLLRLCAMVDRLNSWVGRLARSLLVLMTLLGAANAVLRYTGRGFGRHLSSNALIELQWYLFGAVFLLGGAYALERRAHVRVDVFYERLSRRARTWIDLFGHLFLCLPFCALMVWVSWRPVLEAWERAERSPDPGGLPRFPILVVIPIAFVLLGLQALAEAGKAWLRLRGDSGKRRPTSPSEREEGTA